MLEVLFGNKHVEKILLYIFVNTKCYGTEIKRVFHVPLTPVQKWLQRLEEGGFLTSYYEGKTRMYIFNPAYPLLREIENLLSKAYSYLSSQEKKQFYLVREKQIRTGPHIMSTLMELWEKLRKVSQITFHASSKSGTSWNGRGSGEVNATSTSSNVLIFSEKGSWKGNQGEETSFTNIFRWTLDRRAKVISLEHLRRGEDHPVFLFHLTPTSKSSLYSVDSHLCGGDTYFGKVHFHDKHLEMNWRIIGPKKNEEIKYYYS